MKQTLILLRQNFKSSCGLTEQWIVFVRTFKRELRKELDSTVGITNFIFHRGHFYCSGFFKTIDGKIYYFSQSDVRCFPGKKNSLLIRTAKNFQDYVGGCNHYLEIKEGMFKDLEEVK